MQTPVRPLPQSAYGPPPTRQRGPGLALGIACGGCALLVLLLGLMIALRLRNVLKPTPPSAAYVGTWRYRHDSTLMTVAISADGLGITSRKETKNGFSYSR